MWTCGVDNDNHRKRNLKMKTSTMRLQFLTAFKIGEHIMKNSLMLIFLSLVFANNVIAQEGQSTTHQTTKDEACVDVGKKAHHAKDMKIKEAMDSKEYHYSDGWVQHLDEK